MPLLLVTLLTGSVLLCLVAIGRAVALLFRFRDWRIGFLAAVVAAVVAALTAPQAVRLAREFGRPAFDLPQVLLFQVPIGILALSAVVFLGRFLADRQRAVQKLSDREQFLRTILDSEPECVKCLTADSVVLEMNPAGLAIIEADSVEQIVGRRLVSIVDPPYRTAFQALTERVFSGEEVTLEFTITTLKGGHRWLETHASPLRNDCGEVVSLLGITRDITERKRIEAALRDSEERLRLALDAAQMGTFDWDVPGDHIIWSRWHQELWGFAHGEFAGTYEAFSDRVHPEDLPGFNAEVVRCIAARKPFEREFRVVWPDGSVHFVIGRGEFRFGPEGQPVRMRGVVNEITQRKKAEEERDRLFNLSLDPLCVAGFDGYLKQVNPAWARVLT